MWRLRATCRNLRRDSPGATAPIVFGLAGRRIDPADRACSGAGAPLHLTRHAFDLLWMLASHAGRLATPNLTLTTTRGPARADDSRDRGRNTPPLRRKPGDVATSLRYAVTNLWIGHRLVG